MTKIDTPAIFIEILEEKEWDEICKDYQLDSTKLGKIKRTFELEEKSKMEKLHA